MMLLLVALSIEMFWEAKKKIQGFEEIMVLKFQRNKLRVSPFGFWLEWVLGRQGPRLTSKSKWVGETDQ